jgi:hypothetical protein
MADHFVGFSRGVEGTKFSDFTTGTSTTGGLSMELRITDGAVRKIDAVKFIEALERFIESPQQTTAAGFVFIDG